jgi:indole-3-glycerol phosphate synthase
LGISALVEAHDAREVERALKAGARILGVNNRDLKTFSVDISVAAALRSLVPKETLFVSESGIRDRADIERLSALGADAVLVGETLMRAENKAACLNCLRGIL